MSFRAVSWALDRVKGLRATEKLVLITLAEYANDEDITWRSRSEIAARVECALSTVDKTLGVLEAKGLVSMQGRYSFCDSQQAACASRAPHKHRSGTTYKLHLEVTLVAAPASIKTTVTSTAPNISDPDLGRLTNNQGVLATDATNNSTLIGGMNPTSLEKEGVEFSPEYQGKSHTCEIRGCGECVNGDGSTLTSGGGPHLPPGVTICNKNPQLNLHPSLHPSEVSISGPGGLEVGRDGWGADLEFDLPAGGGGGPGGGVGGSGVEGPGGLGGGADRLVEAGGLIADCLPPGLQVMDRDSVLVVGRLLAERLGAGWTPEQIHAAVGGPIPEVVAHMGRLVVWRLEQMVAPQLAPAKLRDLAAASARAARRTQSFDEDDEDGDEFWVGQEELDEEFEAWLSAIPGCGACNRLGRLPGGEKCSHSTSQPQQHGAGGIEGLVRQVKTAAVGAAGGNDDERAGNDEQAAVG